jgi:nitrite reductase (NO-forming)/hydroxylamine reductase
MTVDTQEYHPEPRVAAIVASHEHPEFIVNVKETGRSCWSTTATSTTSGDHDRCARASCMTAAGTSTKRYFLTAANQSNKIAVIDSKEQQAGGLIDVDKIPHPGRGANFVHPKFGPVWVTSALGNDKITLIGTDPAKHPSMPGRWCEGAEGPGRRLAVRQDPSEVEEPLGRHAAEPRCRRSASRSRCSTSSNLDAGYKVLPIAEWAKLGPGPSASCSPSTTRPATRSGSRCGAARPGVGDRRRRRQDPQAEEAVIKDRTHRSRPTGKFNVYNTVNDVY